MNLKLIIFDLDGTLVDTRKDILVSLNQALEPAKIPPLGIEEVTALIGEGVTRLIEKVLGPDRLQHKSPVIEKFIEHYSAHIVDNSTLYPGVRETLVKLSNVKKAVLSNKNEALSKKLLGLLGIAHHFDLIAGSDTTPERKPSPLAVHHVLSAMNVSKSEAVIVGDSLYDVQTGINSGLMTIGVTYGYGKREALEGANHVINGLNELVPLLYEKNWMAERRAFRRFCVPEICRDYVEIRLKIADDFFHVAALDISERGLSLLSPVPFDIGARKACELSVPKSLDRIIPIVIGIRHCHEENGKYVIGAEIEEVEGEIWFKIFKSIVRFMSERAGEVY